VKEKPIDDDADLEAGADEVEADGPSTGAA
jgi:hypothetical protein